MTVAELRAKLAELPPEHDDAQVEVLTRGEYSWLDRVEILKFADIERTVEAVVLFTKG